MPQYKLTDNHPFALKVAELMAKADELGISFDFSCCNNRTFLQDTATGKEYEVLDTDSNRPVTDFPAQAEYKIVYDK